MISLGIDIGGTGCKCVAFRDTGEQIAMSYREYPTKPGEVNLNALALRESVFFVISDCVKKLDDAKQVAAITVSSFGESFVPVDRSGQPLSDIILYFANTESGEFSRLVESVGAEKFMRITCVLPDASYSLAKMLYTLRTAPRPVWKFLFVASYICFCLSGETVADYSLACRNAHAGGCLRARPAAERQGRHRFARPDRQRPWLRRGEPRRSRRYDRYGRMHLPAVRSYPGNAGV